MNIRKACTFLVKIEKPLKTGSITIQISNESKLHSLLNAGNLFLLFLIVLLTDLMCGRALFWCRGLRGTVFFFVLIPRGIVLHQSAPSKYSLFVYLLHKIVFILFVLLRVLNLLTAKSLTFCCQHSWKKRVTEKIKIYKNCIPYFDSSCQDKIRLG